MEFEEFQKLVVDIKIGKHLPTSIYLHRDALDYIPEKLLTFLKNNNLESNISSKDWNIIKLHKRDYKYSLLNYPTFFDDSYPELEKSFTVNLINNTVRKASYKKSNNPPILHRKETFLPPNHECIEKFKKITEEGESIGLYEKTRNIGFKKNWERLIRKKGYILQEGHIRPLEVCNENDSGQLNIANDLELNIERHKTALSRDKLSVPMQCLAKHGYLDGAYTVLDYGCGRGDDVHELLAHNIDVHGWDPVYKNDIDPKPSDIVNLGYVINVIEDKQERRDTLTKAFQYAGKLLLVSAMLGNEKILSKFTLYKDGVITKNNTFQKYYYQGELKSYLETVLDNSAIAIAPGIFALFKDEVEEQKYLLNRQRSRYAWRQLTSHPSSAIDNITAKSIIGKNKQLFDDFWETILELGRMPTNDEFEYIDQLKRVSGSLVKAKQAVFKYYDKNEYEESRKRRKDDLLVYFALSFFSKRKAYSRMPDGLQRDIKEYFEKYSNAREEGKALLFSIADTEVIYNACITAKDILPACQLNGSHDLVFHRKYLNICPKELRVYIACATQLYGDIDGVDLIKVHVHSGKVSLMIYDDWNKEAPLLLERIKIKLREQDIDFFDYVGEFEPQPLENKSNFIAN